MINHLKMKPLVLFCLLISALVSCDDSNDALTPNPTFAGGNGQLPNSPKNYYIDGTIGGADFSLVDGQNSYILTAGSSSSGLGNYEAVKLNNELITAKDYTDSTRTSLSIEISFIQEHQNQPSSYHGYAEKFKKGLQDYGDPNWDLFNADVDEGVVVSAYDNNGTQWTTYQGMADQSASTFIISELDSIFIDQFGLFPPNIQIKGSFNCTLYDTLGNSQKITNGEYRLIYELP